MVSFNLNKRLCRYGHTAWATMRAQEMKDSQRAALRALLLNHGNQLKQ
jgi:hypothetical protein